MSQIHQQKASSTYLHVFNSALSVYTNKEYQSLVYMITMLLGIPCRYIGRVGLSVHPLIFATNAHRTVINFIRIVQHNYPSLASHSHPILASSPLLSHCPWQAAIHRSLVAIISAHLSSLALCSNRLARVPAMSCFTAYTADP